MTQSTDLDTRDAGEVTQYRQTQWTAEMATTVRANLARLLEGCPVDGEGIGAARMLDRILSAESLADIAEVFTDMDSSEDVVGKDLLIRGFVLRESDYTNPDDPDSGTWYATVDAVDYRDPSRDLSFNSGASTVLAVLAVAWNRNAFPFRAGMERKDIRKTGRKAYNLIPVL